MADYPDYNVAPSSIDIYGLRNTIGSEKTDAGIYGMRNTGADFPTPTEQPTIDSSPTLNDHLLNLYGAGHQAIAAIHRGMAQISDNPDISRYHDLSADEANNNARNAIESMTPAGRDTASRWNSHWIHGALMGAEQQLPMLGAAGLGEAIGGPPGAAVVVSALSAGQAAENFYSAIREMPKERLMGNDDFARMINSGMSEEDAKTQFAHNHVNDAEQMLVGAATGAGVGALGPVGKLFGRGIFDATSQSILKNMATKGLEAGGAMAVQSGLMDLSQQQALQNLNLPAKSTDEILEQAGKMGLWGGAVGSLGGMRRGPKPPETKLPWQTPQIEEGQFQLPGPEDQLRLEPPRLQLPAPTRLLPKPAWQPPGITEETVVPGERYAQQAGEDRFRVGEGIPMGAPDIPALPKPGWQPPEVGEPVGRPPPGRFGRPGPINVPETQAQRVSGLYDQIQELRDLNRQAREGGGGGVTPTADKSMEPSQTPSAPLRSAQAAPIMPDKETLTTDAAINAREQARDKTPVSGENVGGRSGRVGRTKPAAGRDFGPTEEAEGGGQPSIPTSPVDDAHVEALKAAFEQEQKPTIDSQDQLKPETREKLEQFSPEQQQQIAENLRQAGRGGVADMLQQRGREEPPPAEPPPEPPPSPPPPPRPPLPESPTAPVTGGGIPFMVTRAMKADLKSRGFTDDQIMNMTPAQAHAHLREPIVTPIVEERTGRTPTAEEQAAAAEEAAAAGIKETRPGHKPAWMGRAREVNNNTADEVVNNHKPGARDAIALLKDSEGGRGALVGLRARALAMLKEAEEKLVKIPQEFRKAPEGGLDHSPSLVILDEARRFLDYTKGDVKEKDRIKAVEKFLMRENDLREGRYESILAERAKEGEAALAKAKAIPRRGETATEADKLEAQAEESQLLKVTPQHIRTPEEELIHKQRLQAAERELRKRVKAWSDAQKKGIKDVADIKDMQNLKQRAEEALENARELGFDIPKTYKMSDISRMLGKEKEEPTEQVHEDGSIIVHDDRESSSTRGDEVRAKPTRISTLHDLLAKVDYSAYNVVFRGLMKLLVKKLDELAGHVPVNIFDTKEWLKFMDPHDAGVYNYQLDHINIHQDYLDEHQVIVHEAFHAATVYAYHAFPESFGKFVDRLYNEIGASPNARINLKTAYAFKSPIEMLTEMLSNPEVQNEFRTVLVSHNFARELGILRSTSIFRAVLDRLRQALGFEPKYMTAMEAAALVGEKGLRLQKLVLEEMKKAGEDEGPTIDSHKLVKERMEDGYKEIRDRIKYEPANIRLKLKRWFDTPREWGIQMEKLGHFVKSGAFRSWLEHMSKQGYERTQFLKARLPIIKSIATLGIKNPQEFGKLVKLLLSATRNGAHPDDEMFKGRNEFLKPTNLSHWEAIAGHLEDRRNYLALAPETQKIFRNIRDEMTEIHKADTIAARDTLVKNYRKYAEKQSPEFRRIFEKVAKDEELTPLETEKFMDDPYIQDINTYNRVIGSDAGKMFYFPMKRTAWNFSITGTHEYAKPKDARNDPDDPHRWIFDDPSKAYTFTRDTMPLPSYRESKYYYDRDENGKPMDKKYVQSGEVRQIAGENVKPKREYHVVVDPAHVEFANSITEGERIREDMRDAGVKNISGVMPVESQAIKKYGFFGPQIEAMVNRVGKLEHLNARERKAAQDAIEHTAIASMRGNYLPQSLLPRRRIMGTENIDIIKAFADRVRASANFQTMANHRNEIDDALKSIKDEVDNKRTHADATELNAFYNMIEDRTMNFGENNIDDMNISTNWHHIQSFGVLKYLASPAFLAYHQLHVPLVVIPNLSKHVGFFRASKMALDVYRQMTGGLPIVGKGIKGGWERAWNYDREPTNFIDALMQELKKHGGTDDELKAMQWGLENDILHNTGVNFSSYFKGMGKAERFEQRTMGVSAELIGSADAVNRFNSMLMFYRAAKSKGLEGEEAFRWAGDRVAETQGQFTAFNRVGLMRDPRMRAVFQFKSFPLMLMKTVTKAMYNSLRWDKSITDPERVDAIKTLAGLTGASMALSGVQGAVPEPIEDIANVASALGLINTWDRYEDELRGYVADNMGAEAATLTMNGLGGALGVDLTHRGGISELTGLARLHVTKAADLETAIFKYLAGVPGSVLSDGIDGMNAMESGDVQGMLKGFAPRMITDPIKAYQEYNQGVTTKAGKVITPPLGWPDIFKQALGLTPLTASLAREARFISGEEKGEQETQRTKIEQMYTKGDKGYAIRAMNEYNRSNPDNPIRLGDLKKATKETTRKKIFGMDVPKQKLQAQELQHRQQAYGLQPQ